MATVWELFTMNSQLILEVEIHSDIFSKLILIIYLLLWIFFEARLLYLKATNGLGLHSHYVFVWPEAGPGRDDPGLC